MAAWTDVLPDGAGMRRVLGLSCHTSRSAPMSGVARIAVSRRNRLRLPFTISGTQRNLAWRFSALAFPSYALIMAIE